MFTLYSSNYGNLCVSISSKKHRTRSNLSIDDLKEILAILENVKDDVAEDLYISEHPELLNCHDIRSEVGELE